MRDWIDWINRFVWAANAAGFDLRANSRDYWENDLGSIDLIIAGGIAICAGFAAYALHHGTVSTPTLSEKDNMHEQRLRDAGFDPDQLDYPIEYLDPVSKRIMVRPVSLVFIENEERELSVNSYECPEKGTYQFLDRRCPITRRAIHGFQLNETLQQEIEQWVNAKLENKLNTSVTVVGLFQREGNQQTTTDRFAPSL